MHGCWGPNWSPPEEQYAVLRLSHLFSLLASIFIVFLRVRISLSVVFIFQVEQADRGNIINFKSKRFLLLASVPGHPVTCLPHPVPLSLVSPAGPFFLILTSGDHCFHFAGTLQMTASRIATCCAFTYLKPEAVSLRSPLFSTPNHLHFHPYLVVFLWLSLIRKRFGLSVVFLTQGTASMYI